MQLKGKVAFITGGDSGIGLATARLFKEEGAQVAISSNNPVTLKAAQSDLGPDVLIQEVDVTDADALGRVVAGAHEHFGRLDVVFPSAGIAVPTPIGKTPPELFERILRINIAGVFYTVQAASPFLKEGASIILASSVMATMGFVEMASYAASKSAILGMARVMASELSPRGIRVNTLVPGATYTPIWDGIAHTKEEFSEVEKSLLRGIPLGRLNRPEEIARAALYFASDWSASVQAAELVIDGGASHAPQGAPAYRI